VTSFHARTPGNVLVMFLNSSIDSACLPHRSSPDRIESNRADDHEPLQYELELHIEIHDQHHVEQSRHQ